MTAVRSLLKNFSLCLIATLICGCGWMFSEENSGERNITFTPKSVESTSADKLTEFFNLSGWWIQAKIQSEEFGTRYTNQKEYNTGVDCEEYIDQSQGMAPVWAYTKNTVVMHAWLGRQTQYYYKFPEKEKKWSTTTQAEYEVLSAGKILKFNVLMKDQNLKPFRKITYELDSEKLRLIEVSSVCYQNCISGNNDIKREYILCYFDIYEKYNNSKERASLRGWGPFLLGMNLKEAADKVGRSAEVYPQQVSAKIRDGFFSFEYNITGVSANETRVSENIKDRMLTEIYITPSDLDPESPKKEAVSESICSDYWVEMANSVTKKFNKPSTPILDYEESLGVKGRFLRFDFRNGVQLTIKNAYSNGECTAEIRIF